MKSIYALLVVIVLLPNIVCATGYVMDPNNNGYQQLGTPGYIGTPGDLGTPGSGIIPDPRAVPDFNPRALTPRKLDTHLLVNQNGVGDQCKAGDMQATEWFLDPQNPVDTKDKIIATIQTAAAYDTRLRSVHILDEQIDMYYLQPAYKWGFIPTNYYLHVSANGNTLRLSLEKPKWLGHAKNQHAQATAAFATYVPQYLDEVTVSKMENLELIQRDAKMIEVISRVMYQVNVSPISNSFFVCYILPFLLYIILIIVIGAIALWFFLKKIRKETGFLVKKIHPVRLGEDTFEPEPTGDQHVTHFRLPKQ